jgi:hypothetical protein
VTSPGRYPAASSPDHEADERSEAEPNAITADVILRTSSIELANSAKTSGVGDTPAIPPFLSITRVAETPSSAGVVSKSAMIESSSTLKPTRRKLTGRHHPRHTARSSYFRQRRWHMHEVIATHTHTCTPKGHLKGFEAYRWSVWPPGTLCEGYRNAAGLLPTRKPGRKDDTHHNKKAAFTDPGHSLAYSNSAGSSHNNRKDLSLPRHTD